MLFTLKIALRTLTCPVHAGGRRHGGGVALRQEQDVLDTWFSSGLWCAPCTV